MLTTETVLQGRYRIIRQLGQGGMGTVFEAVDQRLDTTVALKQTLFADERLRKQFEREARLLARMHHPALPRVSDHFSEGEGQFLVMQFIAGEDLAEMISKRSGPFPAEQVLSWADQLLDALDYLHTQDPQIIHRDIKPQNLKQTARGQIILLDFGLAKGQTSEVSRVSTSVSIFGYTPNYAPLEQVQGLGTDPRSDIYALSATLYHLLTATKPPDALTRAAAIVNGQADPLRLATEINSAVAPEIAAILEKAMAQNREQRYATAAAMRGALKGTGEAVTVSQRSEANTVLFSASSSSVATPTQPKVNQATIQVGANQPTVQAGETTVVRAPSRKRGISPWLITGAAVVLLGVGVGAFYAYQHRNKAENVTSPVTSTQTEPAVPSGTSEQSASDQKKVDPSHAEPRTTDGGSTTEEAAVKKDRAASERARAAAAKEETKAPAKVVVKRDPQAEETDEPELPEVEPPEVPRVGRRGVKRLPDGATIRNFPDGTQVIRSPDGTRVVVKPDGTEQVFRQDRRLDRRRLNPRPRPKY